MHTYGCRRCVAHMVFASNKNGTFDANSAFASRYRCYYPTMHRGATVHKVQRTYFAPAVPVKYGASVCQASYRGCNWKFLHHPRCKVTLCTVCSPVSRIGCYYYGIGSLLLGQLSAAMFDRLPSKRACRGNPCCLSAGTPNLVIQRWYTGT